MGRVGDKLAVLFLIIGYFYNRGDAASFSFDGGSGSACIIVNMDAVFNISRVYDFNQTEIADQFTLEGANVTSTQSKCGTGNVDAILTLNLFPSSESLKIKFVKTVGQDDVRMSVVLNVRPEMHFNDSTLLPFEMEDDGDLPIGQRNKSFTCGSQQMMTFGQDPGYFMSMKITNMQIQGYDLVDGQLSPAVECAADNFTTTAEPETTTAPMVPTTEPEPVNGTTEETPATLEPDTTSTPGPSVETTESSPVTTEPTPATIEPETTIQTTIVPEPSVPKFDVGNGTVKCIVLEGVMQFQIPYVKSTGEEDRLQFTIPQDAAVTGNCNAGATQDIILTFFENWVFTVQIDKPEPPLFYRRSLLAEDGTYSWKKLTLDYTVDDERFPDPDPSALGAKTVTKDEAGIFQADTQGSYKCLAGESVDMGDDVTLDVSKLQYRAFGETNEDNFPDEGVNECAADKGNDDDDDDSNTTAIVLGSVFGGLAFIMLVVVIIIAIRRRKSSDYEVM